MYTASGIPAIYNPDTPWGHNAVGKIVRTAAEKADLEQAKIANASNHSLRAFFITSSLNSGISEVQVGYILQDKHPNRAFC